MARTARSVGRRLGADGTAANRLSVAATGVVPGDGIQRAATLSNTGNQNFGGATLSSSAVGTPTLLTTDVQFGLQVAIDACSAPWAETAIPATPAGVTASASCVLLPTRVAVDVTGFGAVDRATSYTLTLASQGTRTEVAPQQELKGTRSTTFTAQRGFFSSPGYTLRIRANVNNWTGEPSVTTVSC